MSVELGLTWGDDAHIARCARMSYGKFDYKNKSDDKLIAALRRKGHWTPFGQAGATVHVKAPIFIARQLQRHTVGVVWSEKSGRYATADIEGFIPTDTEESICGWYKEAYLYGIQRYKLMLADGVPREQARAVLPQGMMTEWVWSGSIAVWQRIFKQRLDKTSQKETRELVQKIQQLLVPHFPLSLGEMG